MKNLVEELEKETSLLPMEKVVYEKTLEKFSRLLHPNHHIMVDLEFTLVQLYGIKPLKPKKNVLDACETGQNGSSDENRYVKLLKLYNK